MGYGRGEEEMRDNGNNEGKRREKDKKGDKI